MSDPKTASLPYSNKGLLLKQDPALIQPGYYQELTNLVSPIEGNLSVRQGTQQLTVLSGGTGVLHSIGYLAQDNAGATAATRYIGYGPSLQRSSGVLTPGSPSPLTFASIYPGNISNTSSSLESQRFQTEEVSLNTYGDSYIFFACQLTMAKDNGLLSATQAWGILPPSLPATAALTGTSGGPPAFTGAETPYTYVYTYRNYQTLSESNPSVYQLPVNPSLTVGITPNGNQIQVACGSSVDPQITTNGISVYRAGGAYSDGLYRFLGYVDNGVGVVAFYDTYSDASIIDSPILETDNDPPVPAGLPIPWVGHAASFTSGGSPGAVARITPTIISDTVGFWPSVGCTVIVSNVNYFYLEPPELCYVLATDGSTYIDVYLQSTHTASSLDKLVVTCDTQINSPCNVVLFALGAVFLAGNYYTPHILYKSKPGLPESWAVLTNSGVADAIIVTDPDNPIKGLFEFGGGVIVLALRSVYYVGVFSGVMNTPQRTPAQHGCVVKSACCRVMNEIWYVSYDGIYSYSGGIEVWKSEEIDPLFHGIAAGNYAPIDMRTGINGAGVDVLDLSFNGQDVVLGYLGTDGYAYSLRYNIKLHRWSIDYFGFSKNLSGSGLITAQNVEFDTGNRLIGVNYGYPSTQPVLMLADSGTSDNWPTSPTGGDEITFFANMQTLDNQPDVDKFFSDVVLECENDNNSLFIQTYYNFSSAPNATDTFSIAQPSSPIGRIRYPFNFHNSAGYIAYAASIRVGGDSQAGCVLYSLTLHWTDEVNYNIGLGYAYRDLGYNGDKTFRAVIIEIDTGGGPAEIFIDVDGVETDLGPVTTTTADRKRIVSVPTNITGKMARLRIVPTTGYKTNVYNISWDYAKEPLAVNFFDSLEYSFNYNGYSFQKQAWFQYFSTSPITIQFYSDDSAFYSVTLPAHPNDTRLVERFYFPAKQGSVLNKAKTHRFEITSSASFRIYRDSSRIEWLPIGADQRSGYQQLPLTEIMQPQP